MQPKTLFDMLKVLLNLGHFSFMKINASLTGWVDVDWACDLDN
jgi:hypothetical protein